MFTLGYYRPPFTVKVNYKLIFTIPATKRERLFYLLSTIIHEYMHLFQFILIAHFSTKRYMTLSYLKISEHQAYYANHILAKIIGVEYDYNRHLKLAWKDLEEDLGYTSLIDKFLDYVSSGE
jgi:hypothetical protein